jgi:hypothetical protein
LARAFVTIRLFVNETRTAKLCGGIGRDARRVTVTHPMQEEEQFRVALQGYGEVEVFSGGPTDAPWEITVRTEDGLMYKGTGKSQLDALKDAYDKIRTQDR